MPSSGCQKGCSQLQWVDTKSPQCRLAIGGSARAWGTPSPGVGPVRARRTPGTRLAGARRHGHLREGHCQALQAWQDHWRVRAHSAQWRPPSWRAAAHTLLCAPRRPSCAQRSAALSLAGHGMAGRGMAGPRTPGRAPLRSCTCCCQVRAACVVAGSEQLAACCSRHVAVSFSYVRERAREWLPLLAAHKRPRVVSPLPVPGGRSLS